MDRKERGDFFARVIVGRSGDWKYRAVAGLVTREMYAERGEAALAAANAHGLSRAVTDEEREAWSFGFEWLIRRGVIVRLMLCDVLQGRVLRLHAARVLTEALELEARGVPAEAVDEELGRAAHLEWIAARSEQGQILWGGRLNRCGRPEDA